MISKKIRQIVLLLICISILSYYGYKAFVVWDNHDPDFAVANMLISYLLCFFVIIIPIWKLKVKMRSYFLHVLLIINLVPSCYIAINEDYGNELKRIIYIISFIVIMHTVYFITLKIIAKKKAQ